MPGILPYITFNPFTGEDGAPHVMISQEKWGDVGEWDFFNGRLDKCVKGCAVPDCTACETPRQAAIREGYEESVGLFGTKEDLDAIVVKMTNSRSTYLLDVEKLKFDKIRSSRFDIADNANNLENAFIDIKMDILKSCSPEAYLDRKKLSKYAAKHFQEKTAVKWVSLATLIDACATETLMPKEKTRSLLPDGSVIRSPLRFVINNNKKTVLKQISQSTWKNDARKQIADNNQKIESLDLNELYNKQLQALDDMRKNSSIDDKDAIDAHEAVLMADLADSYMWLSRN